MKLELVLLTLLSCFFFSSPVFGGEFQLSLVRKNLSEDQRVPIEKFLRQVETLVPQSMKNRLNRSIPIEFVFVSSSSPSLQLPACGPFLKEHDSVSERSLKVQNGMIFYEKYGWVDTRGQIYLNRLFISFILSGPEDSPTYPCGHKTLYRLIVATILHELGHLYDFSPGIFSDRLISGEPRFQRLMGWSRHGWRNHLGSNHRVWVRSPDVYEFSDLKEGFAVNLEFFLLDPEYECRRPALHAYLAEHFGGSMPFSACGPNTKVHPHARRGGIDHDKVVDLNPERVFEVHYLRTASKFATDSRADRSMIRIVLCDPARSELESDCLEDLDHQWGVSFAPLLSSGDWFSWQHFLHGLSSQLWIYPMKEVVEFFKDREGRDLESYPLLLTQVQKKQLIYRVLENYWSYLGRLGVRKSGFVGDNSSAETGHLLKGILSSTAMKGFVARNSVELKEKLVQLNLISSDRVKSPRDSEKSGLFFPSAEPELNSAFEFLKVNLKTGILRKLFTWGALEDYLTYTDPAERLEVINQTTHLGDLYEKQKLYKSFLSLESRIEHRLSQELHGKIHQKLGGIYQRLKEKKRTELSSKNLEMFKIFMTHFASTHPLALVQSGYGVPTEAEFGMIFTTPREFSVSGELLREWMLENFGFELIQLKLIQDNKMKLSRLLGET